MMTRTRIKIELAQNKRDLLLIVPAEYTKIAWQAANGLVNRQGIREIIAVQWSGPNSTRWSAATSHPKGITEKLQAKYMGAKKEEFIPRLRTVLQEAFARLGVECEIIVSEIEDM